MDMKIGRVVAAQINAQHRGENAAIARAAQEFEASYLGTVFSTMFEDALPTPAGGFGEEMFRGVLANAMAREVAEAGGVGIASSIEAQLRKYRK